jgi:hypothetical protein
MISDPGTCIGLPGCLSEAEEVQQGVDEPAAGKSGFVLSKHK